MITLLIARHGNTFDKGDILLRVGARTDLPLSQSGKEQAQKLGIYLQNTHPNIDTLVTSELKRTQETATLILQELVTHPTLTKLAIFNEIDYGPDDGKPEEEVIARVGKPALEQWDNHAIPPPGWNIDVNAIKNNWQKFLAEVSQGRFGKNILVVTSNGIARFVPVFLDNYSEMQQNHSLKLSTGALSCLVYENGKWQCQYWNKKP